MELLFKQDDITLVIWTKTESLTSARNKLNKTLADRSSVKEFSSATLPFIQFGQVALPYCQAPFFFENKLYEFEFTFAEEPNHHFIPVIEHQSKAIEERFHYSPRTKALRGTINFGNDIGHCQLILKYYKDNAWQEIALRFDVLPTKMDLAHDYESINRDIDKVYPLWRFAFANKTTMAMGKSQQSSGSFELLWLAHFKQCQADFEQGVKRILNAPHNRLTKINRACRLDQLSNRLPHKIEQKAKQAIIDQQFNKRINITKQKLTIDTNENQFIKMALLHCKKQLGSIATKVTNNKSLNSSNKLSESSIKAFNHWQTSINKQLNQPLWREVSSFKGLNSSSLVLQQRSGYAKVFKIWQILKKYLDKLASNTEVSVKSIDELYEVWCFVAIKEIIESLGFVEVQATKSKLKLVVLELNFDKKSNKNDVLASSFVFKRDDGIKLRLVHEPVFNERSSPVKAWLGEHKPDILVEVSLPYEQGEQPEQFYWLFDAKYRVDQNLHSNSEGDKVPSDAINQMHRYRDALIHFHKDNGFQQKSRPVFGAFALYPGFYDQAMDENYYDKSINEIGIGAFALLPTSESQRDGSLWLKNFFIKHLKQKDQPVNYNIPFNDQYFIQDAVRIPYKGTDVVRYQGLTLVAPIVENGKRTQHYITSVRQGTLLYYHTQLLATNRQSVDQNIVREIQYIALAVSENDTDHQQQIKYLYPVLDVVLKARNDINADMSGLAEKADKENKQYWLFTLGDAIYLPHYVSKKLDKHHFEFKLTTTKSLRAVNHWQDIQQKYFK